VRQGWTTPEWRHRFAATLEGDPYTLLVARRGGGLLGGVVARTARRDAPSGASIPLGIVMDLIVAPEQAAAVAPLLAAAETWAATRGALAMLWLDGVRQLSDTVARCGYRPSAETYRLIVWPGTVAPPDSPLRDASRWRFTFADHDAF
jgi:hypothetical protein